MFDFYAGKYDLMCDEPLDFAGMKLLAVFLMDLLSFDRLERFDLFDEYETRLDLNSLLLI